MTDERLKYELDYYKHHQRQESNSTTTGGSTQYEITPDPPPPLTEAEEPSLIYGMSWGLAFGCLCITMAPGFIAVNVLRLRSLDLLIPLGLFCSIPLFFFIVFHKRRKRLHHLEELKAIRNVASTRSLSESTVTLLGSFEEIVRRLPGTLTLVSESVKQAEQEYRENAFAPYWDAVEQATRHLGSFNGDVQLLSQNTQKYYTTLNNRIHTFPSIRTLSDCVPDATPVLIELRRVVRMGQTNYQFATIWEQRKTREVLIAGFHTLGEAIDNLGSTVEKSISQLGDSIRSSIGALVEAQISTREVIEEQTRQQGTMLDNIQRHREPTSPFGPSK